MGKRFKNPYHTLQELSKKSVTYSGIGMVLEWDQETFMPSKGIDVRSDQIEALASLIHKEKTSSKFSKALSKLIDLDTGNILEKNLTSTQKAALREWRREYLKSIKLPSRFVKDLARCTSSACHTWQRAKKLDDFSLFQPHLEKIVTLCKKQADFLGYDKHPYDALLNLYEPELKVSDLIPVFTKLKLSLIDLLKRIQTKPKIDDHFLHKNYPVTKQMQFGQMLLKAMGFDEESSRLDLSAHPMCMTLHPQDTRMTTKVLPNNVMSNILSVIHEGGHGLYNMNLPQEQYGTPICASISYGVDESQSRMWETIIGKSRPFWKHFFPLLQSEFPENLALVNLEDFYRAINRVEPHLIRIESDEVTYNLHIMIRFEIEKALIEGSLKVKEIPEVWSQKTREYLGLVPKGNSDGCLQDIHWSLAYFGYFPSYTLGNLYAAQFFATFERAYPLWQEAVSRGDLSEICDWCRTKIHQYGKEFTPKEIIVNVTEKPLSAHYFTEYLEKKYREVFHL